MNMSFHAYVRILAKVKVTILLTLLFDIAPFTYNMIKGELQSLLPRERCQIILHTTLWFVDLEFFNYKNTVYSVNIAGVQLVHTLHTPRVCIY